MSSKLKIKMSHIEFEYEGDAQFDTEAIKDLFSHLESLVGITPAAAFDTPQAAQTDQSTSGASDGENIFKYSQNTIAAKLGASTGSELVIASAAYLHLVAGQESFKRQALLDSMKAAKSYYKGNMSGNLTRMIAGLVAAGKINELSNNEYSLSAGEQSALKARLSVQ